MTRPVEIDPGMESYVSWDGQRTRIAESSLPEAGRAAGLWAIDQLRTHLGENWPKRATRSEGDLPRFLAYAFFHAGALGELLIFALRLWLLKNADGIGNVRTDLRTDLTYERRLHTGLLLELAGLGLQQGHEVSLETLLVGRKKPTDVVVATPSGLIVAETFAITNDKSTRDGLAYTYRLRNGLNNIAWTHAVTFDGPAFVTMTTQELAAWLDQLDVAAAQAAATGERQNVDHPSNPIAVVPVGGAARGLASFTGPVITNGDQWRLANKLANKAAQAVEAGGDWIRVDVLDGLWQFTEWASWPLARKADAIAAQVREAVGGINGLLGAVISCGPAMGQGDFTDENVVVSGGVVALRRVFAPLWVRETIIVPTRTGAEARVAEWVKMYDAEPAWLDWALAQAGLLPATEIFGPPDPNWSPG